MDSIKLVYVLLLISYCYAIPLQTTTTEKSMELVTKSEIKILKSNNGLSSTQSPPSFKTNQLTSNKSSIRVLVKPISELNSPEALYQMATSLLMKEKRNWLQTEKWLIDNVYRLKNELGDVKRELNEQKKLNSVLNNQKNNPQFLNQVQISSINEQVKLNYIQDLNALRGDHSSINQQQQQLIEITKTNQQQIQNQADLLKQLLTMIKEQFKNVASISQAMVTLQQINDSTNTNTNQLISKLMYDLSSLNTKSSAIKDDVEKSIKISKQQRSISPKEADLTANKLSKNLDNLEKKSSK